jgi:hypothetical protein
MGVFLRPYARGLSSTVSVRNLPLLDASDHELPSDERQVDNRKYVRGSTGSFGRGVQDLMV